MGRHNPKEGAMGQLIATWKWCVHGQVELNDTDQKTIEEQQSEAEKLSNEIEKKEQLKSQLRNEIVRMSDAEGNPLPGNEVVWRKKMIKYTILDDAITKLLTDYRLWEQIVATSEHVNLVRGNHQLHQRTRDLQQRLTRAIETQHDMPELQVELDGHLAEHKQKLDVAENATVAFRSLMDPGDIESYKQTVKQWKSAESISKPAYDMGLFESEANAASAPPKKKKKPKSLLVDSNFNG